jgi:aryl-alcohol dehydrogenase-like predicted oxidoreductase
MRYRLFGPTGLRVCELFLGAMTFGEQGGVGAPPEECQRILDAYADAGGNVIDTAVNYRGGAGEEILGELLAGRRDQFVLSTKYTVTRDPDDPNAAGNPPQKPAAVTRNKPAAAAHRLHRPLLGAHVGPALAHPGPGRHRLDSVPVAGCDPRHRCSQP